MEDSGQGGRSSGRRAIGDVAGELRGLRRDLRATSEITSESAGLLAETVPKVTALEEHVARLQGQVAALVDSPEDQNQPDPEVLDALGLAPSPRTPWCWPALDADTAALAWVQLARFVGEVLTPRHRPTRGQVPDCWPAHPHAVEALSWLRATYRAAHLGKAPATVAADWATRWTTGAYRVIADSLDGDVCGPGRHLAPYALHSALVRVRDAGQPVDRPPEAGGLFRVPDSNIHAEMLAEAREVVHRFQRETSPWRPRVMNLDEASVGLGRDRDAIEAQPTRSALWLPIWRDIAAADVEARRTGAVVSGTDYQL